MFLQGSGSIGVKLLLIHAHERMFHHQDELL
jgi:hypothetical protein